MIDQKRLMAAITQSPEAREQATAALTYSELGDIELMALHAAAVADIVCNADPTLGHPIDVARFLQATLVEAEVQKDRMALLN